MGGELWIGNWGSGEDLKVIEVPSNKTSHMELIATS
jgi:hypothetical protein